MKTARGVEGEGFANFVDVVLYCKLFFPAVWSIMENPNYNKRDNIGNLLAINIGRVGGELGSVEERRLSYNALVNLYGAVRRESWERGFGLVSKF